MVTADDPQWNDPRLYGYALVIWRGTFLTRRATADSASDADLSQLNFEIVLCTMENFAESLFITLYSFLYLT